MPSDAKKKRDQAKKLAAKAKATGPSKSAAAAATTNGQNGHVSGDETPPQQLQNGHSKEGTPAKEVSQEGESSGCK